MEITDIRIKRVESDNKLKAYVTITFDNCFVVHNLKIIMGQFGRFVAMPSRKTRDGEFKDIAHPINSEFRRKIQARILEEFDKGAGELHISGQDDDESTQEAIRRRATPSTAKRGHGRARDDRRGRTVLRDIALGRRQVVSHRNLDPAIAGSNPAVPGTTM